MTSMYFAALVSSIAAAARDKLSFECSVMMSLVERPAVWRAAPKTGTKTSNCPAVQRADS